MDIHGCTSELDRVISISCYGCVILERDLTECCNVYKSDLMLHCTRSDEAILSKG